MASPSYDLHVRIRDDVVGILDDLDFPDLAGGIENEAILEATNFEMPCIVVSTEGEQEKIVSGTTLYRYVSYPLRIFILQNDLGLPQDQANMLGWRATIFDELHQRRQVPSTDSQTFRILPNCPEVYDLQLTPRVIFDERIKQYRYVVSGFLLEAFAKIRRTGHS